MAISRSNIPKSVTYGDKKKKGGIVAGINNIKGMKQGCLLYTSPSPRDGLLSRMPSSA